VNLEPLVSRAPMELTASRVAPELWSVSPARMPAQAWRPMATSWSIGSCLVLLLDQWQSRGIAFVTLGEGIATSTAAGQLVPGVLASIPVFERARIQERIRAGLSRAKAHGTRLGRRRSVIGKETVVCRFTCACENRQVPGVNPLQEMGTEAWHGWSQHREQRQLEKQAAATASNGRCSDDGANVLEFQHDDCGWLAGPTKCLGRCWNAVRK
jgi:hypothetical protein